MKFIVSVIVATLVISGANAAQSGRPAMAGTRVISSPRYTASVNQLNGMSGMPNAVTAGNPVVSVNNVVESVPQDTVKEESTEEKVTVDMREAERNACINNNIGVGNTFVWASKYSNTDDYASMVEDSEHPENNVCFVRVELKSSNESRIKVSDIEPKYFMWGEPITCGSWVSKKEMEKRILDAKKGVRIGGIVASTIGGMGLGVGAMELFGNRLIGGKVEGQKSASSVELYKHRLLALQKSDKTLYDKYVADLHTLSDACRENSVPSDNCNTYNELLKAIE